MTFTTRRLLTLFSPVLTASVFLPAAAASAQSSFATISAHPTSLSALFMDAAAPVAYSSSVSPDGTTSTAASTTTAGGAIETASYGPFSAVNVTAKFGSTGVGFDVATPLARHFGLRSGFTFFSYNTTVTTDGLNIAGAIKLQNASSSIDIYPFHNSFRISPGISFANHNRMFATLNVPGGQNFTLNDQNFVSDPSDPVHGAASFSFGKAIAPRLTMGWGKHHPAQRQPRQFSP